MAYSARPVRAQTTPPAPPCNAISGGGTIVTCTGNVSTGVLLNNGGGPYTTLNVNNLTAAIAPASGVDGIRFSSTGAVRVDSDTGTFGISTTGSFAEGIFASNASGAITVTSKGDISTAGTLARGIAAYSSGTDAISVTSTGNISTLGNGSGIFYSNGIYARSTGGGSVSVTSTGIITTQGTDAAIGILARSTTGAVTVSSTGDITTAGSGADGIFAQNSGSGAIAVTSVGNVTTLGNNAEGIVAVSGSGTIAISSTGNITVSGNNASGIFAISASGNSTVTIVSGTVQGGTGSGAGVNFDGAGAGTVNTLFNHGNLSALSGIAVVGGVGNDTVENFGTVTGNVFLSTGANAFINRPGALFNSGTNINLDTGNTLTNHGTLAPGGVGTIQTTALSGNIVQVATGTLAIDVNPAAATADRVNATGTANLSGAVAVNLLTLPVALNQQFTILSATGGVTNSGLGLVFPSTVALTAQLLYPNPNDVVLGITVDFSPNGLNRNQTAIGDHLNSSFAAGGGGLSPLLLTLLGVANPAGYTNALDQLSPEIYNATRVAALYANEDFTSTLMSCRVNGADAVSIVREGQCLWFGGRARFLNVDTTRENIGFDETAGMFAVGAQVALNPVWRLGVGLGYQTSELRTDTGAHSDGDQAHGGVVIKYNPGSLLLAAAVSGGYGWYDTTRPMSFGGFSATAKGDHEVGFVSGRLHASYLFGTTQLYVRPTFDVSLARLSMGDIAETGAGGASLIVAGRADTVASVAPGVQVGGQWTLANGVQLRPYVKGGVTWLNGDELALDASFAGTPAGVAPFSIRTALDDIRADFGVGLDVIGGESGGLRIHYDGHIGSNTEIHSIGVRGHSKF